MREILLWILLLISCMSASAQDTIVASWPGYPKSDTILYYQPLAQQPGSNYPAAILLHGYGGGNWQWPSVCDLQSLANEYGMILICPDGFKDSWYIDSPSGGSDYATFFASAILPAVERGIPVDTSMLFIDGMSMGGHGALHLAIKCCGKFAAAGSISGVLDLRKSSLASTSLSKIIGPAGSAGWINLSAVGCISQIKECGIPLIISCGAQDYLAGANRDFAAKCSQAGVNAVYVESPGRHDRLYWSIQLPEHLRFFRKFTKQTETNIRK